MEGGEEGDGDGKRGEKKVLVGEPSRQNSCEKVK